MSLDNIRIVLVRPVYGGNVGSVCRAMMNMGLSRLTIVGPQDHLDWEETRKMSHHAVELLDQRASFATLAEAVFDCGLVAGTTARMGLYRSHALTPREWAPRLLQQAAAGLVAVVFGPEDKGLSNEELALCTQIIQIPSSPRYLSLNLAQAVMICGYELYVASGAFQPVSERSAQAPSELRERMFDMWRKTLVDIGFMKDDKADHMMMGLRRILSRGKLTVNDVHILMGIARQAQWCADQLPPEARSSTPSP
jgi:tRNA/rRNA methyltransferase